MSKAQEFIRIKKRKRAIKRLIISLIILIIAIVIFIYKAPIFNVKQITFKGMTTVNEKELQSKVKDYRGQNIFTIDKDEVTNKVLQNPYIKEAKVKKKGISALNISVEEVEISYYIQDGANYKVITNEGFYVEQLTNLEGKNLVSVVGVQDNGKGIGEKIIDDENTIKVLNEFTPLINSTLSELGVSKIDVSNVLNIKAYINGVEILFGDTDNLIEKMNTVLNILEQNIIKKGYIDVSFDGAPVVKIES